MPSYDNSWGAVELILHDSLHRYKQVHSKKVVSLVPETNDKKGAVAVFRSKGQLKRGHGLVMTSLEALQQHQSEFTHWTPNTHVWLGYNGDRDSLRGMDKTNISQINTFVVDVDFEDANERDKHAEDVNNASVLDTLGGTGIPTLMLKTDRGYQIYYVLKEPAFVAKRKSGSMPVIATAEKITDNLKLYLSKSLSNVDMHCSALGVFRMPTNQNTIWFDPTSTYSFDDLMSWSMQQTKAAQKAKLVKIGLHSVRRVTRRQIDQSWYQGLIRCTAVSPDCGQDVGRHNTLFTLALANYSSNVPEEAALVSLIEFNERLELPLSARAVELVVRDAYSGKFAGARKDYIQALLEAWDVPEVAKTVDRRNWYKFAKPRNERSYSHVSEWAVDVLKFINARGQGKARVQLSTRAIRDALKISAGSLNKVLKQLRESGQLIMRAGKGSQAPELATISMLLTAAMTRRLKVASDWWAYVQDQLQKYRQPDAVEPVAEAVDLFDVPEAILTS